MKWLIQEFLNHNASVETIMEGLESEGRDFLFVRLNKDDSMPNHQSDGKKRPQDGSFCFLLSIIFRIPSFSYFSPL